MGMMGFKIQTLLSFVSLFESCHFPGQEKERKSLWDYVPQGSCTVSAAKLYKSNFRFADSQIFTRLGQFYKWVVTRTSVNLVGTNLPLKCKLCFDIFPPFSLGDLFGSTNVFILPAILNIVPKKAKYSNSDWQPLTFDHSIWPIISFHTSVIFSFGALFRLYTSISCHNVQFPSRVISLVS